MKTAKISAKATLLWHLLEEGTVTRADLVRLTGWTYAYTASAIHKCLQKTWAQRTDLPRCRTAVYGLTALGIEEAMKVTHEQVVFACTPQMTAPTSMLFIGAMGTTAPTSTELKHLSPGALSEADTIKLHANEATMESPSELETTPQQLTECWLTWRHDLWLVLGGKLSVKLAVDQARQLKHFLVSSDLGESTGAAV